MSAALVLVWLGTATARAAHEPELASWAASRMVSWEDPEEDASSATTTMPAPAVSATKDDAAQRVEVLLSEARTTSDSGDPAAAITTLDAAEQLLREHASLPQAAWLLAEIWRQRAVALRETDPEESASLSRRAEALGGPRAPSFEASRHTTKGGSTNATPTEQQAPLRVPRGVEMPATGLLVSGPSPGDQVELDGSPVDSPVHVIAGTHQIRVLRRDKLVWAGFVDAEGSAALTIPVPRPRPCSDADLGAIKPTADGVDVGKSVRCGHFAIARATPDGGIEVVRCFGASCGNWLPWKRTWGRSFEDPVQPPWPEPKRRTWILWTAAGVVAVAAGSLALWEAGVFERRGPTRESFVWVPPR